ncbi:CFEM domain-containing protein [Colletotrichum chrysophilum]|uniref:CFEM domain-containing protein n=1 Tax=Colletotrichum chrysophilum TaxID=1836956 RepID=A0AAD9AT76_9PEZI|nr:CFEM domain-containing protein [Colletotrichum chrysophilum]
MKRTILNILAGLACQTTMASAMVLSAVPSNATSLPTTADPAGVASQQMSSMLSPCAMNCTAAELAKSTCQPTDFVCICTNQQLNDGIAGCLMQNCTVVESLRETRIEAQNYSKSSCGAPFTRNLDQPPITWTIFTLSFIAVSSRFISKIPSLNPAFPFGWDDWAILASMVRSSTRHSIPKTVVSLGFGQDIWTVAPDNITQILLIFFAEELFYSFVVAVTKLSVIIFYLRLFQESWFRKASYGLLGITTMYGIGQILAIIFVCSPVSYNWTRWDGQHAGQCGKVNIMTFVNGGTNIAIDLALVILPVTQFITVSWTIWKKIGVSLIFLVGLLIQHVSSIDHLNVMISGSNMSKVDFKALSIWSLVEMHASVICACMPGMTAFVRRVKPRLGCHAEHTPEQIRNKPRTGRSAARKIRETFSRITAAAREVGNTSTWNSSKKTTTSTMTGTQLSTIDRDAPEYRDYVVYAPYAEQGDKALPQTSIRGDRAS